MISIERKADCTGCNACLDICPKQCIGWVTDELEGFWYPKADTSACIHCNLCESVCPVIHVDRLKKNDDSDISCFAAINKNIEVRFNSTTGGIFSALAEEMYRQGGYVGGAVYADDFSVRHFISDDRSDLVRLRQSKYSQSDTRGFFGKVKELLVKGEKVLVCGTPCQMAALKLYLKKDYEHLIVVDFVCRSITSPLFYKKYLDFWERSVGSKLVGFKFKDKELGWRGLVKRFDFKNKKSIYSRAADHDLFSGAFHSDLVSRPSCYECKFRKAPHASDLTLGDFWGCERIEHIKRLDDNAGTSAVICNTPKGLAFFESTKADIDYEPAKLEQIKEGNPALKDLEVAAPQNRAQFFIDLNREPIEDVVPRYRTYDAVPKNMKRRIKELLNPVISAWSYANHSPWQMVRFFYYNLFCRQVKTHWKNSGVLYPTPYSVIDIHKSAKLELAGELIVGEKKTRKSRVETRLIVGPDSYLSVSEHMHIGYGSDIEVHKGGRLTIDRCGTNYGCSIICANSIKFIGHVSLGREVSIRDTNAHIIAIDGYKTTRPIVIENHVWICSGAAICPGVKIHTGAVVGSNSMVIQNVPAHSLVSGSPAQVVKKDIAWKL